MTFHSKQHPINLFRDKDAKAYDMYHPTVIATWGVDWRTMANILGLMIINFGITVSFVPKSKCLYILKLSYVEIAVSVHQLWFPLISKGQPRSTACISQSMKSQSYALKYELIIPQCAHLESVWNIDINWLTMHEIVTHLVIGRNHKFRRLQITYHCIFNLNKTSVKYISPIPTSPSFICNLYLTRLKITITKVIKILNKICVIHLHRVLLVQALGPQNVERHHRFTDGRRKLHISQE